MAPTEEGPGVLNQTAAVIRLMRHEVGDLLQTVYAAVALLRPRLPSGSNPEQRILGDLRERARSCRDLLDTIHDLVAPMTLDPEEVDLRALLVQQVQPLAERYPWIQIQVDTPPVAPLLVDPRRLRQLVQGLTEDACRSAVKRVTVALGQSLGGGEVVLSFEDDGPGVAPEFQSRLFDSFTTTPHGHLGPMLALARRLVTEHGGRIAARNNPEGGFRVDVWLPRKPLSG